MVNPKLVQEVVTRLAAIAASSASVSEAWKRYNATPPSERPKQQPVFLLSNSLPVGVETKDGKVAIKNKPGGLGIGINGAFTPDSKFEKKIWLGISPEQKGKHNQTDVNKQEQINSELHVSLSGQYLFIDPKMQEVFYKDVTNGVLWPMHHDRFDLIHPENNWEVYEKVNQEAANTMVGIIKSEYGEKIPENTMVWVHDYHLQSAAKYLKEEAPELKVGHFHHLRWLEISSTQAETLGVQLEGVKENIRNAMEFDSLGFHTNSDKENFIKTVRNLGIETNEAKLEELRAKIVVNPIGIPKQNVRDNLTLSVADHTIEHFKHNLEAQEVFGIGAGFDTELPSLHQMVELNSKEWVKNKETAVGEMKFDPEKIHIGSVSRLDYTKGIVELVDGFHKFLKDKQAQGMENPEDKYQLNIVASAPRDIAAYLVYQELCLEKMNELENEFPGSINYIPGIPNTELPMFNAIMDISAATSPIDGYILSVGEALVARTAALELPGLLPDKNRPSALIVSKGAGISESLDNFNGIPNIPESLSLITPSEETVANALETQITRIEEQRQKPEYSQNMGGFLGLEDRLSDTLDYGKRALEHLKDAELSPAKTKNQGKDQGRGQGPGQDSLRYIDKNGKSLNALTSVSNQRQKPVKVTSNGVAKDTSKDVKQKPSKAPRF
jgi:trehalose-6-phosphate synthase